VPVFAGKITISSLPVVSSPLVIADDTTTYTVTMTVSAEAGYDDITCVRLLFNYTESAGDSAEGRGYLAWGQTDEEITAYGGSWVLADAVGGGRWGYRIDAWGGDTYLTPLACETSTGGQATGGTGTRTVTWTFKAKPAWAANPLINDADAWAGTANDGPNDSDWCRVGWVDNPVDFDVVASSCGTQQDTPSSPIVSNPTPTTIDVAINPADSDTDLYAIRISPPIDSQEYAFQNFNYVQADGSVGGHPVWRSKADWGTTTVTGLTWNTTYHFTVRAFDGVAGTCPSEWGPETVAATTTPTHVIDCAIAGIPIHKGIHGMDAQAKRYSSQVIADTLAVSWNTSMRFGGDGYNWKTRTAQWGSNSTSVLEYLRYARDRNSYLQILVNTRGIGTGNGSTWEYTDQSPATLAALAADWVYYCNVLVQTKRQGDPLTAREQALLDSLDWGDDDKLLAPGEPPVPRVDYWEIGNEPEGPFPPPVLSASEYDQRYQLISQAMLAEDPTIKVGPNFINAYSTSYIDAILSNPMNQVDFLSHHSYGGLYFAVRDRSGGSLDAVNLMKQLNMEKKTQQDRIQAAVDRLVANNYPADTPQIISEMNPSDWRGTYYYELTQTVVHGLGVAETIFSYIEKGIFASQYWDQPNRPSIESVEQPGFQVYKALQSYLKGVLVDSTANGYFRLYTTRDADTDQIILWAINFSETADTPMQIQLQNLPRSVTAITRRTLSAYTGETSLIMKNNPSMVVGWTETDLTGQLDPSHFTMTFDNATLTMLIFDFVPTVQADTDRDGDVDLEDFGRFQVCYSGVDVPQSDPDCRYADLDGDTDVDVADLGRFLNCMTGPGTPPDVACAD